MKSSDIRRKVAALKERKAFLEARVERAAALGKDYTFDRAEAAALGFALECIELCCQYGVVAFTNYGGPLFRGQWEAYNG